MLTVPLGYTSWWNIASSGEKPKWKTLDLLLMLYKCAETGQRVWYRCKSNAVLKNCHFSGIEGNSFWQWSICVFFTVFSSHCLRMGFLRSSHFHTNLSKWLSLVFHFVKSMLQDIAEHSVRRWLCVCPTHSPNTFPSERLWLTIVKMWHFQM